MHWVFLPLAQRGADSPINRWLGENPVILGLILLLIGGVLAISGVYELRKGVAHDKYGNEMRGGMGQFVAIVRIVGGLGACGFALYKIIVG